MVMNMIAKAQQFRPLNSAEILLVAGGDEEQEIVVTGTRMTQQQRDAYDSWRMLVAFDVYASIALGAGLVAGGGAIIGGTVGVIVGAGGLVAVEQAVDSYSAEIEAFINETTNELYKWDGRDGVYDGYFGYAQP